MALMKRCCCCSVKKGSLVMGIISIIGAILTIAKEFWFFTLLNSSVNIVLSLINIVISSLLIHGVRSEIPKLLTPILVFIPIEFVIRWIIAYRLGMVLGFYHEFVVGIYVATSFGMLIAFFIWLCVFSHYKQLTKGSCGSSGTDMKAVI